MQNFFKPIIVLTSICLVVVTLLSFTYQFTLPYIEAAKEKATEEALTEVFPGAEAFTIMETMPQGLNENISAIYNAENNGYVFTVSTKGYGGKVIVMVGVENAGTVTGVKVTEHTETPGLGSKATLATYLAQYVGMSKSTPELISGATITSTAVKTAVQTALDAFIEVKGGQNQ